MDARVNEAMGPDVGVLAVMSNWVFAQEPRVLNAFSVTTKNSRE